MSEQNILAIDQGTTSSRAIVFGTAEPVISQYEFAQHFPDDGWVEHDPEDIWQTTLAACKDVLKAVDQDVAVIGITNQRETTVLWDRQTGIPIFNAIVWQDRRTADSCAQLERAGHSTMVKKKTGLVLDAYFSATKISWILDQVEGARARAEKGELAFGTIDTFLLWRLTNGAVHATDATNASRTLLFNIHTQAWDDELLDLFNVPASLLPDVKDSSDDYGVTDASLFGRPIPIGSAIGDQQAALFGQACFSEGEVKCTYGTGCFMIMNTGSNTVTSKNQLLTTVGYRLDGKVTYALEGSIFNAGTAIQWLRDGLELFDHVDKIDDLLKQTDSNELVYMVPAFTGLGAPHWDPDARGAIFGITRDTGIVHFVRAALEAVCYQTLELLAAMQEDSEHSISQLRVDGGMIVNQWLLQFLADIIDIKVEVPSVNETTAIGAAYLAGLQVGIYSSPAQISELWAKSAEYDPGMDATHRQELIAGWNTAIERVKVNHSKMNQAT